MNHRWLDSELRNFMEEEEAVAVYLRKLAFKQLNSAEPGPAQKINRKNEFIWLANEFHVSPKAIMDVWNHKTRVQATSHLWEAD